MPKGALSVEIPNGDRLNAKQVHTTNGAKKYKIYPQRTLRYRDVVDVKEYYIVKFIFESTSTVALWYTSQVDGFVLDENKQTIKTFENETKAKVYAQKNNYNLCDEKTEILCVYSKILNFGDIDFNSIITFWNMVSDVANSLNLEFLGDVKNLKTTNLYNKVFYGCNLPALKNDGADFLPSFTLNERQLLQKIIMDGIKILSEKLV